MDLATLGIKINNNEVTEADAALGKLGATGDSVEKKLRNVFAAAAAAFGVQQLIHKFTEETIIAQNVQAQLEAGIRSTGGAAGFTAEQLSKQAEQLQQVTIYADDTVKAAQSILLTFDKIRGDNFARTTTAVTDLAARMGGDLAGAAFSVGKALNDPVGSLTLLRRQGIQFNAEQKDLIKTLAESGKITEAQSIILDVLQKKFEGSAAAARNTLGGALKGLENDVGDLFEMTTKETSALVEFINLLGQSARAVGQHRQLIIALAEAMAFLTAGVIALSIAGMTQLTWFAALIPRLAAASAGVEVLNAAVIGFGTTLGTVIALAPIIALTAAFGVLTIAIRNARLEAQLSQDEIAGAERDADATHAFRFRKNYGIDRAREAYPSFFPSPKPKDDTTEAEVNRAKAAEKLIESLKQEADTIGLTAAETRRYKVLVTELDNEGRKLTGTELSLALAQVARINKKQQLIEEMQREKDMQDQMASLDQQELGQIQAKEQAQQQLLQTENSVHAAVFDNIQAMQQEAEDQARINAVSKQSREVRNALRITMAGEAVVRQAINDAQRQGISLSDEELANLRAMAELREKNRIAGDTGNDLKDTWQSIASSVANVVNLLANADSGSSRFLATLVTGIGQVESAMAKIKEVGSLGVTGVAGLVATGIGLVSSFLGGGETPAQRRSREIMEQNNIRLAELRKSVDSANLSFTGTEYSTAKRGTNALLSSPLSNPMFRAFSISTVDINKVLSGVGTNFEELKKFAKELDITLDTRTRGTFIDSLKKLQEAINLTALVSLTTLSGKLDLLNRKWSLLGSGPLEKIADLLNIVKSVPVGGGSTGPGVTTSVNKRLDTNLGSLDFNRGADRSAGLQWILAELERARTGQLKSADLGDMTLQEYLDFLSQFGDLLNQANQQIKDAISGIKSFRESLLLSDLSPLSAKQKLDEAGKTYEEVLSKAQTGDLAALQRLPEVARQFLEFSRAYNASSPAYVADFNRVMQQTEAVMKQFEDRQTEQGGWEIILPPMKEVSDNTSVLIDKMEEMIVETKIGVAQQIQKLDDLIRSQADAAGKTERALEGAQL